jgi:capsular polysaccharide biosynthesis protein
MRTIFHIDDRGARWIFHWFIYMMSGLRFLLQKKVTTGHDGNCKFEQNPHLYNPEKVQPPYYLYFSYLDPFLDYQKETFPLLTKDFQILTKEDIQPDDIVVNHYGEFILNNELHIAREGYQYLRDLMCQVEITPDDETKYKYKNFYLRRSRAHTLTGNAGDRRRQVLNEDAFIEALKAYQVEGIFLEDLTVIEKIKLFRLAKTIISPNSGGLVFTLVCNPQTTTTVEINVDNPHQISRQYRDQCRCFNIPYHLHTAIKMDHNDNMRIDITSFLRIMKLKNIL